MENRQGSMKFIIIDKFVQLQFFFFIWKKVFSLESYLICVVMMLLFFETKVVFHF